MFFPFTMNAAVADSCHGSLELTMSPSFIFMSDIGPSGGKGVQSQWFFSVCFS